MKAIAIGITWMVLLSGCGGGAKPEPTVATVTSTAGGRFDELKHRNGLETPETMVRLYAFRRAKFMFDITGAGNANGTLVMVLDAFGHFESKISTKTDRAGRRSGNWTIKRGLDLWHLDPATREATLVVMKERSAAGVDLAAEVSRLGSEEAAREHFRGRGIEILPDEDVKGYRCQVIRQQMESHAMILWVYQGVELRMAVQFPGGEPQVTRELISADFDPPIPEGLFEIPADYSVLTTLDVTGEPAEPAK